MTAREAQAEEVVTLANLIAEIRKKNREMFFTRPHFPVFPLPFVSEAGGYRPWYRTATHRRGTQASPHRTVAASLPTDFTGFPVRSRRW
jgi:hypothetical protein